MSQVQSYQGRSALITGGGTGIGRAIALELAGRGCSVAVAGRRGEKLLEVAAELDRIGVKSAVATGDVSQPNSIASIVETTVAELGGLDILINNAGVARAGPIDSHSVDEIDTVVDIDLKGPIHATRAALPHLRKDPERGASILNISSNVTFQAMPNYSVYSAAKAGVDMLTRCLALELAADRIRVNAICPGVVETPIFETMMPAAEAKTFLDGFASAVPLGRIGRPEDIARIAATLCDPANDWVTGVVMPVDGGLSLGTPG